MRQMIEGVYKLGNREEDKKGVMVKFITEGLEKGVTEKVKELKFADDKFKGIA